MAKSLNDPKTIAELNAMLREAMYEPFGGEPFAGDVRADSPGVPEVVRDLREYYEAQRDHPDATVDAGYVAATLSWLDEAAARLTRHRDAAASILAAMRDSPALARAADRARPRALRQRIERTLAHAFARLEGALPDAVLGHADAELSVDADSSRAHWARPGEMPAPPIDLEALLAGAATSAGRFPAAEAAAVARIAIDLLMRGEMAFGRLQLATRRADGASFRLAPSVAAIEPAAGDAVRLVLREPGDADDATIERVPAWGYGVRLVEAAELVGRAPHGSAEREIAATIYGGNLPPMSPGGAAIGRATRGSGAPESVV